MDPIEGDAFGEALLRRHDGGYAAIVIERDDGFVDVDESNYFADATDDPFWTWLRARITGRVLDVGAGAGRASIALQREGVDVTALDVSPAAIEVCRRRGVERTLVGTVAEADGPFDTFVAIGNNLGLLASPAAARPFLDALRAVGRPDARLVGTIVDPYRTEATEHLAYHEANRAAGRLGGEVRIRIRHRRTVTPWFGLLWLAPEELATIAAESGWKVTATSDDGGPIYAAELVPTG